MGNIVKTEVEFFEKGIRIKWFDKEHGWAGGHGFGQVDIYDNNGELTIDSEFMSKEFVKELLNHIVDTAVLQ